jgi:hypothetical protein
MSQDPPPPKTPLTEEQKAIQRRIRRKPWKFRRQRQWSDETELAVLQVEAQYIADPQRRPLEWFYETYLKGQLSLSGVRQYAHVNRWHDKRQSYWKGVTAAYLKQQHTILIQERLSELGDAKTLRDFIFRQLRPRRLPNGAEVLPIQARSYEGMARAFVAIDQTVEGKRAEILASVEPALAAVEEEHEQSMGDLPFSSAEMVRLAHGLMEDRRRQRRIELAIEDDDDDDDDENDEGEAPEGDDGGEGDLAGSDGGVPRMEGEGA